MDKRRKMILGAVTRGTGSHVAGWRHPEVSRERLKAAATLSHYAEIATMAEAAKMHFVFLADSPTATYQNYPRLMEIAAQDYYLEPMTVLAALVPTTRRIGLVGTMSTTYSDPYTVARTFASLDHLSGGRASWNIVTTTNPTSALNFGHDAHMEKSLRYGRAEEFVRVVKGLWDSWEDDAFLRDQKSGRFLDLAKMHPVNVRSENFRVRGPLNIERAPQGYPVMFVAGSSEGARELAAETGDAMFTAQPDLAEGQRFYADVKGRLARYGRKPADLSILLGAMIITGRTDAEAREKHEFLRDSIGIEFGLQYLTSLAGVDLSSLDLDAPLPAEMRGQPTWSRLQLVLDMAAKKQMTLREIAIHYADTYGHQVVVGSAATVADELQALFEGGVADGFLLRSPFYPDGLKDICEITIPELQRRGLFRTEYEGETFRDNLGLARPPHPATLAQAQPLKEASGR
jgi:FMN-dependent oxidoreductase (nitrilotriacetate monooxygenase family)